ncbi:hypothetical protein [Bradyrhizobium sp.]|jgi:hypothetical protein|uniref:hypothetical protein n=1 Tax=Bradyrhizobium TaxID=374 RepID=UPI0035A6983D
MNIRYHVDLSCAERAELGLLLAGGSQELRKLKRAQILLAADAGMSDDDIATTSASAIRRCIGPVGVSSKAIWLPP